MYQDRSLVETPKLGGAGSVDTWQALLNTDIFFVVVVDLPKQALNYLPD